MFIDLLNPQGTTALFSLNPLLRNKTIQLENNMLPIRVAQERSQNAEKLRTSKGDYLIKNCVPFRNGNFS